MWLDSCLYKDFHNFIDWLNRDNGKRPNLIKNTRLRSIFSHEIPDICIHEYIDRIIKNIYTDETHIDGIFIVIIVLLKKMTRYIKITNYNIHRLIGVIAMISQKIYDDTFYNNEYWAYICGVPLENMNMMEQEVLQCLDFRVFISHGEMMATVKCLKYLKP